MGSTAASIFGRYPQSLDQPTDTQWCTCCGSLYFALLQRESWSPELDVSLFIWKTLLFGLAGSQKETIRSSRFWRRADQRLWADQGEFDKIKRDSKKIARFSSKFCPRLKCQCDQMFDISCICACHESLGRTFCAIAPFEGSLVDFQRQVLCQEPWAGEFLRSKHVHRGQLWVRMP